MNFDKMDRKNLVPITNKISVIYGRVQCGKRDHIIQYAVDCIKNNRHCVIITNNITGDVKLMYETLVNYGLGKHTIILNANTILKETECNIVLALFNTTKLSKIYKLSSNLKKSQIKSQKQTQSQQKTLKPKINFIFDEGDISKNTIGANRCSITNKIIKKFNTVFVSATPKSVFFENNNIMCNNVYKIPIPEDYIPVEKLNIIEIENNKNYEYLETLLDKCSTHTFIKEYKSNKLNKLNQHTICTIKGVFFNTDRKVEEHNLFANYLHEKYPDSYVVVNNDKDIKITYPNFMSKAPKNSTKSLPSALYEIQQCWKDRKEDYVYLFLIGSNKISRCTPIRAELKKKPIDSRQMLLITNMVYIPSAQINEASLVQQIRLVGIFPGPNKPQLNLFTLPKVKTIAMKYNKEMDNIIENYSKAKKIEDNSDLVDQKSSRNTCTFIEPIKNSDYIKCYNIHKRYTLDGLSYLTEESFKEKLSETKITDIEYDILNKKNSDTYKKIINILLKNRKESLDQGLTSRQIYDSEFTDLTGITPYNTISARCSELYKSKILDRIGNVPYIYKLNNDFNTKLLN